MVTPRPSLDSVKFDATDCEYRGEPKPGELRVWHTPEGDGLGLYFVSIPPDLPRDARSQSAFAASYATLGPGLVELQFLSLDGCPALKAVTKVPQQPSGMTYLGSFILPFRDFSFVLKVQCAERGATGGREAVLFDEALGAGTVTFAEDGRVVVPAGWNPDNAAFDVRFPEHPLSRARRVLARLALSVSVDARLGELPGFHLPRE
jgi:hypothetical protein